MKSKTSPASRPATPEQHPLKITLSEQELVNAAHGGTSRQILDYVKERYRPINYTASFGRPVSYTINYGLR